MRPVNKLFATIIGNRLASVTRLIHYTDLMNPRILTNWKDKKSPETFRLLFLRHYIICNEKTVQLLLIIFIFYKTFP